MEQAPETEDKPAPDLNLVVDTVLALALPHVTDVPRESAQETAGMARYVLRYIRGLAGTLARDVDLAADARRRLAIVTDTVAARELSRAAVRDMNAALRIAERALGQAMRAALGGTTGGGWREYVPDLDIAARCRDLEGVGQDEFETSLDTLLGADLVPTFERVMKFARDGNTPETEELDTGTVDDHSDLSPDEVAATVTAALSYLSEAARIFSRVTPEMMRTLSAALAADWARQVWDDAVPVLYARKSLIERGND